MKKLLFFTVPILLAIISFFIFSLFLSKSAVGRGALQVTAIPTSNVYLNGKLIGKTPLCKCEGNDMLATGDYTLKLVPVAGDNLSPYEQRVTITKSILTVVDRTFGVGAQSSGSVIGLTPLQDNKSAVIFISSFPSSANVTIDGNASGQTPLLLKNITDSDHELLLQKEGYKDKTIHVHTVLGYQLDSTIFLGIATSTGSTSAGFSNNTALTPIQKQTVVILSTPTGFLRVRYSPSLSASEAAQVKPGDSFDYVDETEGWYEVKLSNGQNGWVSSQYAQKK